MAVSVRPIHLLRINGQNYGVFGAARMGILCQTFGGQGFNVCELRFSRLPSGRPTFEINMSL